MQLSIFTDELAMDVTKALPIIKGWGIDLVDFRGRVFGKPIERLTDAELADLRKLLDDLGMRTGCIESSLAKVPLPRNWKASSAPPTPWTVGWCAPSSTGNPRSIPAFRARWPSGPTSSRR